MRSVGSYAGLVALPGMLLLAAACGGGGSGGPRSCDAPEDCGSHARCSGGACVDNSPPVALLSVPGGLAALELVELDGSSSTDPDAPLGDRTSAFHWTFTSLDHACAAPVVTGTESRARVRFACSGSFRVSLVVSDLQGEESAPATAELAVGPHTGTSAVAASADQVLNHACAGTPLTCTTEGAMPVVSASLAAGVTPVGTVRWHWSAVPPDGIPLDAHRRVTFSPSADVANPSVRIEVDATAIQAIVDDWVLRVSATDDAGPLGEATTRLSIGNRTPTLAQAAASVSVDHTYSAGSYRATADASRWLDPDGDPLALEGSTGSSICSSVSFRPDGTAVVGCARVSGGTPSLTGFVATHQVAIRPRDPWGATAATPSTTALTILNRAVVAADSTVDGLVSCSEIGCCRLETGGGGCGVYRLSCSEQVKSVHPDLSDPDGDPLTVTWAGGGFVAQTVACEPAACTGTTTAIPAYSGCTRPHDSRAGTFTATDGLTSDSATLTYTY